MKKSVAMCVVSVSLGWFSGCAGLRAIRARDHFVKSAAERHVYERPCGEIWSATRTFLFAREYQVRNADASAGLTLETEWKGDGQNGGSSRYLVQGIAPTQTTCQIVATRSYRTSRGDTTTTRDWNLEWNILKQVDLVSAQRIEADAQAAGEVAANQKD